MIQYSEMLHKAQDNQPHDFVIVAKGDDKRPGGYLVKMNNATVLSSFHYGSSFNLKSLNSEQIRKIYTILILKFDGQQVKY
jgi:hypothetical protein